MLTRAKYWGVGAVLVFSLAMSGRAAAFRPFVPMGGYMVRLEGRLGAPRDSDKGTFDMSLGLARKKVRLQLTELRVLSGGILPNQILNAVDPYKPNIFLRGAEETLQPVLDADAGAFVEITGYLRGRDLLVSQARILAGHSSSPRLLERVPCNADLNERRRRIRREGRIQNAGGSGSSRARQISILQTNSLRSHCLVSSKFLPDHGRTPESSDRRAQLALI